MILGYEDNMLNGLVSERAKRLINVQFDERRRLFPLDISKLKAEAAQRGYHSGGMIICCDIDLTGC